MTGNEHRQRESGLFSLVNKRLLGDLITALQYLQGSSKKMVTDILPWPVAIRQGIMALN